MKVKLLSRVRLLATPWTAAYQAPPPMGFSRQEYWSGVPLPSLMKIGGKFYLRTRLNPKSHSAEEMKFGYRSSVIQETGDIVISAKFALSPGNYTAIQQEMKRLTHLRELKQPLEYPSCGSVFKRPLGHFAGQLISEAGLKGHRIGGVEVSTKHAGFMVNIADGNAQNYEDLIAHVIQTVEKESGIKLEREVRIIGETLQ